MKKFLILLLAIIIATPMFISCQNNSAKVETKNDTINYAIGATQGSGIRQYVLENDTADNKKIEQFCEGIEKTFKKQTTKERLAIEGFRFGAAMSEEFKTGFLLNDSTIPTNKSLFFTYLKKMINLEKDVIDPEIAIVSIQELIGASIQTGVSANLTPEQADSVNMLLGIINGNAARKYILGKDTTDKDIEIFINEVDKGLNNTEDNIVYIQGLEIGSNMYKQFSQNEYLFPETDTTIKVDIDIIRRGLIESLKKSENAIMTSEEATSYINKIVEEQQKIHQTKVTAENKKYAEKGEKFLAENAKREGVIVTESGLQYEVITMGKGEKPTAESIVKVHYHGTLIDGTVFDSSVQRGEPIEFPLNGVIKGWTEGLQLMPVGSKFKLYIPYQLAYGEHGAGADIGPCEALIFEVELLEIVK